MRKFKPKFHDIVYWIMPENTDDLFIDISFPWEPYKNLVTKLGKNVFVFDVEACEFLIKEE